MQLEDIPAQSGTMICLARMGVNPFDIQLRAAISSNSEPVFLTRGRLRIVIIKPYKYLSSGYVERFRKGFMPTAPWPTSGASHRETWMARPPRRFHRLCGHRGMHPMSGGFGRLALDSASDYKKLRLFRYGIDLAELPRSIELSTSDKALA